MMHDARHKMGEIAAVIILLLFPVGMLSAQELEYNMELGGMAGGCFYMGDANKTTPKETAPLSMLISRKL